MKDIDLEDFPLLYSEVLMHFREKLKNIARVILEKEVGVALRRNSFIFKKRICPLEIVVFAHPSKLGYFSSEVLEIGINSNTLYSPLDFLKNLLRHEIAHYLCHLEYGDDPSPHGENFQKICKRLHWSFDVSQATASSEDRLGNSAHVEKMQSLIRKVQKLLALEASSNLHEAKAAAVKARELLLQFNLEETPASNHEIIHLRRVYKAKRSSAKLQAIADILRTFFVRPVTNHGSNGVYLEVFGKPHNVEIATYVAATLDRSLDHLWENARKSDAKLTGITDKNAFMRGVAKGFISKNKEHSFENSSHEKALILIEKELELWLPQVYPRLFSKRSKQRHSKKAETLGEKMGKSLTVNPAISTILQFPQLLGF